MTKRNLLILTSIKETRNQSHDDCILLGEWCKDLNEEDKNFNIEHILNYHWDDRVKLKRDYKYLKNFHYQLLSELTTKLNSLHGVNYDLRYWRILLDPWLMDYVSVLFDRWETIDAACKLDKKFDVNFLQSNFLDKSLPLGMNQMHAHFSKDYFNQLLYQKIIEYNYSDSFNIKIVDTKRDLQKDLYEPFVEKESSYFFNFFRGLYNHIDKMLGNIFNKYDVVFIDSYFRYFDLIKINLAMNQFPRLFNMDFDSKSKEIESLYENQDNEARNQIKIPLNNSSKFENFILEQIIKNLPKSIVENYSSLKNISQQININTKVIMSANSHWDNLLKKFWIAHKVSQGVKFVTLEHGGSFPPLKEHFQFEEDISDKRGTWFIPWHEKHIQLPPTKLVHRNKLINKRKGSSNRYKRCSLIAYGGRRWAFRVNFYPHSYQGLKPLEDSVVFYNNLDTKIKDNFQIKLHHDLGLNEIDRFRRKLDPSKISTEKNYDKFLSNSKVIVCTYPETTFAEAMSTNIPTIMFFDKNIFERNPITDNLLNKLVEAKIIFFDAKTAAKHLNKIWDNLDVWWNSDIVLNARIEFRKQASPIDKYWISKWKTFINDHFLRNSHHKMQAYGNNFTGYLRAGIYTTRLFVQNPVESLNEIISDVRKDQNSKLFESKYNLVWCAGLPHSGTTLVEEIFDSLPYIRLNSSPLRFFNSGNLTHPHSVSREMFLSAPINKYSFFKTHSHYDPSFLEYAKQSNARIIVCLRDIRDMMISRYWHIMSNKYHWLHLKIKDLPMREGFIESLISVNEENYYSPRPIEDYFLWIKNWIEVEKKEDIKIIWYEDYVKNSIQYIYNILDYLEFSEINARHIEEKLESKRVRNKSFPLSKRLFLPGRMKSTYRSGKSGEWRELFDDNISEVFNSYIPGEISEIIDNHR